MMILKRCLSILGLMSLLALSGCGGGGGSSGTSPLGGGSGPSGPGATAVADLVLTLSSASVLNTGAAGVTATVTALDANRNAVAGAPVVLSANSDAVVTIQGGAGSVTSAAGTLVATVGTGSNRTNRTITVTATSGSVTKTATLQVVDGGAVVDLVLTLSSASILNNGAASVTATVTALDANRNAVSGAPVVLSANSDAVVTVQGAGGSVTSAAGTLVASVSIGSNRANRTITVTATSGAVTKTATLQVVDAAVGTTPSTIELIASATTVGTGGDPIVITAFVKDENNNALPAAPVTFKASTGTLSSASSVTNAAGAATASFSSGVERSNRTATITVTSGTVSKALTLPITGTRLTLSGPSSLILSGTSPFDVTVTDSKGNVVPGTTVTATSSLGNGLAPSAGAVTNSSGQTRFVYTATNAGIDKLVFSGAGTTASPSPDLIVSGQDFAFIAPAPSSTIPVNTSALVQVRLRSGGQPQAGATINFAATGGTLSSSTAVTDANGVASVFVASSSAGPLTVQASVMSGTTSATLPLLIVATQPSTLVLQVSPTALAPNSSATGGSQAQLIAKVTDTAGNPVQGQTVNFSRTTDPSGGNLLQASATTDQNGQASVAYRPGAQSTAENGVVFSATVANTQVSGTARLTVNQSALFIALGTGNVIGNLDPQTYQKDWVVYVTDSTGIPVNGATLTIKTIPTHYITGRLDWDGFAYSYAGPIYYCKSEDTDGDGILGAGEDTNGDGRLWPGNVIGVTPGSVQTVSGRATISLIYAESYAPWVRTTLTASATVAGTESKTSVQFIVSGSAGDFTVRANPPAALVSPFGLLPTASALASGNCVTTPPP